MWTYFFDARLSRKDYNPNQPRAPRGTPEGGQWVNESNTPALGNDQINSSAFKKWFGDSKVVDEEGKPLVVYHGTKTAGFDVFDFSRSTPTGRIYFAVSPKHASDYASDSFHPDRTTEAAALYPVFLSIQNPIDLDALMRGDAKYDGIGYNAESWRKHGYDGAFAQESDGKVWIAFAPHQIKSAIGNRGTFDARYRNILKSLRALKGFNSALHPRGITNPEKTNRGSFRPRTGVSVSTASSRRQQQMLTENEVGDALAFDLPRGFKSEVDEIERKTKNGKDGISVTGYILDARGNEVAEFERRVERDANGNLFVHNIDLNVNAEHQKSGIALEFYRESEKRWMQLDVHHLETFANSEVGRYAWARMGFDYETDGIRANAVSMFAKFIKQKTSGKVEIDTKRAWRSWEIATFDVPEYRDARGWGLGKQFMLDDTASDAWNGVKRLDPQDDGYKIWEMYYAAKHKN